MMKVILGAVGTLVGLTLYDKYKSAYEEGFTDGVEKCKEIVKETLEKHDGQPEPVDEENKEEA